MSEPDVRSTPPAVPPAEPDRMTGASRAALAGVALVLLVLGTLAWLDLRRDTTSIREDAAKRLATVEAATAQARERDNQIGGDLREMQAKIALLEARLAESQSQQAALEALYHDLSPSRDDLALHEVEQILLIANQQLALAGNVPAALAALQLADAKLARIDRPPTSPLRRALARDVERLKALPYVDVAAVTYKLDQAIGQIDSLPLARDERLPEPKPETLPAEQPAWRRILGEIGSELRALVRLEVSDRPAAPLVTPDQAYFLRENLRLRLLSARVAVLGRQEATYRNDLRAATDWLRRYFDTRTKPVQGLLEMLSQMQATPLPDDLPDLGASLEAVRLAKLAQEQQGLPPPPIPARPNR